LGKLQATSVTVEIVEDALLNELNLSNSKLLPKISKHDDYTILLRGCDNQTVNRIHAAEGFDQREKTWMKPPSASVILDHVNGAQTADRRNTVMYSHFVKKQSESDQNRAYMLINKHFKREDSTQISEPINYELYHEAGCRPRILYFTSRYALCYNPFTAQQSIYQGHVTKISCMTQHPFLPIAASGAACEFPRIFIWDQFTMETIVILETSHEGGVLQTAFSRNGQLLISIGFDKGFSMQIFQWANQRTLAYRSLGYLPVFCVKWSPYNHKEFITCGYEHLQVWKLKGTYLTCSHYVRPEAPSQSTTFKKVDP
jgi:hypothetical protein